MSENPSNLSSAMCIDFNGKNHLNFYNIYTEKQMNESLK